jgi:cyanophycinase
MTLRRLATSAALIGALAFSTMAQAITPEGPKTGTCIVIGGGKLGKDIVGRFIELAGGPDAPIVLIPTASGDATFKPDWEGLKVLTDAGARNVVMLHTLSKDEANSEKFVEPLRKAKGLWISGGRQWHLVDSYLGTRTVKEIKALLARGGVVAGTSAGASIQAQYLVRGAREGNTIMMAPGYEEGFGLVEHVAVDQHINTRGRVEQMGEVIAKYPDLLGIGLDENTAIETKAHGFTVLGAGHVHITEADASGTPHLVGDMTAGQHYYFAPLTYAGK